MLKIRRVIIIKRVFSVLLIFTIVFSFSTSLFAKDYDEAGIYYECYTLYPDFVDKVKNEGVNDKAILNFLQSVEKHLSTREDELNEENFDKYMFDAIEYSLNLKKNIPVRDALTKAYPDALPDAMKGVVPEEYMPIYNTVKRILFGITTPVVTLSGTKNNLSAHYLHMPEDAKIYVGFFSSDGTLLHAHVNVENPLSCHCESSYAIAFAFSGTSLAPLCESYTLEF